MQLQQLLSKIDIVMEGETRPDHPALQMEVTRLSTNSQDCQPGDLFIGMPGTRVDGGEFWPGAIASGAIAAIISPQAAAQTQSHPEFSSACIIPLPDMSKVCAQLATAFFAEPGRSLRLAGVTGTNGKTTTTHLIEYLLNAAQQPTALLGTLYARWPGYHQTALYTTPFAVTLQEQLAMARDAGTQFGVMEISSHALAQHRVLGCPFEVAVFTNLTQDHLDYHKDLDDYFAAKALLFSPDYLTQRAVVNASDPFGQRLIAQVQQDHGAVEIWTYSTTDTEADIFTTDLTYGASGVTGALHTPVGTMPFSSPLVGQFNIENVLAAVGAALQFELSLDAIVTAIAQFPGVPGRVERVQVSNNQDIGVIVDYAHTPDSLENLLNATRPFAQGRMICVFGCGGDRDRTKRPQMGDIAARLSDWAIVTSDNPRTENPDQILQDIVAGIPDTVSPLVEGDRATAIRTAIIEAKPGDTVLIAGKGHEDYQILGTEKVHFDDREQARIALTERYAGVENRQS
ncbi:MAG: UDP-N-acetylmuramoyl-L-alanyl-D-glutamate--2,6-diaminopimelate ligase [Cyanothece sp. SIO2G6]|nr:UDP-N-acetylmuramoyl-L-alanyl-D-glutamate--2,6-diaminopimelate ligase [Cyanothece sp. SIO2G6]